MIKGILNSTFEIPCLIVQSVTSRQLRLSEFYILYGISKQGNELVRLCLVWLEALCSSSSRRLGYLYRPACLAGRSSLSRHPCGKVIGILSLLSLAPRLGTWAVKAAAASTTAQCCATKVQGLQIFRHVCFTPRHRFCSTPGNRSSAAKEASVGRRSPSIFLQEDAPGVSTGIWYFPYHSQHSLHNSCLYAVCSKQWATNTC